MHAEFPQMKFSMHLLAIPLVMFLHDLRTQHYQEITLYFSEKYVWLWVTRVYAIGHFLTHRVLTMHILSMLPLIQHYVGHFHVPAEQCICTSRNAAVHTVKIVATALNRPVSIWLLYLALEARAQVSDANTSTTWSQCCTSNSYLWCLLFALYITVLHSPHVISTAVKWYASTDGHSFQQSGSTDNHGKWYAA